MVRRFGIDEDPFGREDDDDEDRRSRRSLDISLFGDDDENDTDFLDVIVDIFSSDDDKERRRIEKEAEDDDDTESARRRPDGFIDLFANSDEFFNQDIDFLSLVTERSPVLKKFAQLTGLLPTEESFDPSEFVKDKETAIIPSERAGPVERQSEDEIDLNELIKQLLAQSEDRRD